MIAFRLCLCFIIQRYVINANHQNSDLFSGGPGSLVLSSVDEQIKSVIGEQDIPWPGFIPFQRNPRPPLYGLTYFPWRTKADCSTLTHSDIENDLNLISQVSGSIYITELFCDFGPFLVNLTRHYEMSILLGVSANDAEFRHQRDVLVEIFNSSHMNLSHVVAVAVGHNDLRSIVDGRISESRLAAFQAKLRNVTDIVESSQFRDIPVSTADSVNYLFRQGIQGDEEIYVGTFNTMEYKNDPFFSTMFLYEGVLQIRNKAEEEDEYSANKPIILTDIGWASGGYFNFTTDNNNDGQSNAVRNVSLIKPNEQKLFLYYLRCSKYPVPPMYYVHSAFDLTWKYPRSNSAAHWGLADAVSRQWKPGILSALVQPCLDAGPPAKFDDQPKSEEKLVSGKQVVLIAVITALVVIFLVMFCLVLWFWKWKREAVRTLKRSQQQQLELMRNISTASTGEVVMVNDQSRYLKEVSRKNTRWDDYLNMLEPDYEDLSHMVAPELRIDLSNLELMEIIGEGHFGIVQKARYREKADGIDVAVKRLHVGGRNVNQFLQEGIKMQQFNHPNIMNLIGISFTPTNMPLIITPYLEEGDVLNYVKKNDKKVPFHQLINFCAQIAEGMRYLHALKMIHRDLAARNCMLDKTLTVMIADFGLCRDISDKDSYQTTKAFELPIRWMPPEAIESLHWNSKSDVWSYGVVMWELVTRGKQPYSNVPLIELRTYLRSGGRLEQPDGCPDVVYQAMRSCWSIDESRRPSFVDMCHYLPLLLDALEKGQTVDSETYYNLVVPWVAQSTQSAGAGDIPSQSAAQITARPTTRSLFRGKGTWSMRRRLAAGTNEHRSVRRISAP